MAGILSSIGSMTWTSNERQRSRLAVCLQFFEILSSCWITVYVVFGLHFLLFLYCASLLPIFKFCLSFGHISLLELQPVATHPIYPLPVLPVTRATRSFKQTKTGLDIGISVSIDVTVFGSIPFVTDRCPTLPFSMDQY